MLSVCLCFFWLFGIKDKQYKVGYLLSRSSRILSSGSPVRYFGLRINNDGCHSLINSQHKSWVSRSPRAYVSPTDYWSDHHVMCVEGTCTTSFSVPSVVIKDSCVLIYSTRELILRFWPDHQVIVSTRHRPGVTEYSLITRVEKDWHVSHYSVTIQFSQVQWS